MALKQNCNAAGKSVVTFIRGESLSGTLFHYLFLINITVSLVLYVV